MTALKIENLTKIFRKQRAVDGVSLEIKKGEIYGLVGANGAGKTTLLRLICGFLKQDEGTITRGEEIKNLGVLIEKPGIYKDMSAFENLRAKSIAIDSGETDKQLLSLLELVGLGDVGKKRVGAFSMGMKQRLGIALALVGNPDLLLLDEPINGLDLQGIKDMRDIILNIHEKRNITMIISSHILSELAKIITRICVMKEGKLLLDQDMQSFMAEGNGKDIEERYFEIISK